MRHTNPAPCPMLPVAPSPLSYRSSLPSYYTVSPLLLHRCPFPSHHGVSAALSIIQFLPLLSLYRFSLPSYHTVFLSLPVVPFFPPFPLNRFSLFPQYSASLSLRNIPFLPPFELYHFSLSPRHTVSPSFPIIPFLPPLSSKRFPLSSIPLLPRYPSYIHSNKKSNQNSILGQCNSSTV